MALVFPNNPSLGQISVQNGRVYVWSGYAWEFVSVGASGNLSATVTIPSSGDQYWSNVTLLLNGNGGLADSSNYLRSLTNNGGVSISSSTKKYGSSAIQFSGASGSYLSSISSDWAMNGDFTIEGWAWLDSSASDIAGLMSTVVIGAAAGGFAIYKHGALFIANSFNDYYGISGDLPTNTWAHFALVNDNNTLRYYVNGVQQGSMVKPISFSSNDLSIGALYNTAQQYNWKGFADDIRITSGVCRYPNGTTFIPPSATYVTGLYTAQQTLPVIFSGGTTPVLADSRFDLFLPPAPTNLSATAGNAQASLSWTAPSATYIPPITDYVVQFKEASASLWNTFSDGTSTATSATVTGLTNGTAYAFRVAAVNDVGTGAFTSASSNVTPSAVIAQYLVIAGGAGGGVIYGGGGGAGGYLTSSVGLSAGVQYTVTVGAGGARALQSNSSQRGSNGSNSVFSSITAIGGGGGGGESNPDGAAGGSGGGALNASTRGAGTAGQGYNGGVGYDAGNNGATAMGGGGGGADSVGGNATTVNGGNGGAGLTSSISGAAVTRAGGGGGAANTPSGVAGVGGSGGGGNGARGDTYQAATAGATNTGSGGGGGMFDSNGTPAAAGGSGVVILRTLATAASTTGSPAVTQDGSYTVYTFTGTGSITF